MYAAKCHAFAKALHWKELEFNAEQNASAVEALISINNQLQQTDAAFGILKRAQAFNRVDLKETWFEKLQRWEEALTAYQKRERDEGENVGFEVIMGKMRCLHALGEWDTLSNIAQDKWLNASTEHRKSIAPLAAAAAWGMGQWEVMDTYLNVMKTASPDRSFFGAILSIHRNQFEEAHAHITKAREGLDTELSALLGESYTRAYSVIVRVQMLAELEEIITYKRHASDAEKQERMRETWSKRLKGCQRNVEVWQRMMKVRALVITPRENTEMYIKFASICRKAQRGGLAEKSLNSLVGVSAAGPGGLASAASLRRVQEAQFPVQYAVYKFLWSTGHHHDALSALKEFSGRLRAEYEDRSAAVSAGGAGTHHSALATTSTNGATGSSVQNSQAPFGPAHAPATAKEKAELDEWRILLARCYLKQGDWQIKLHDGDWESDHVQDVLQSYNMATRYNEMWYKAWHAWALANFEVVTSMAAKGNPDRGEASTTADPVSREIGNDHVVPAIKGFFKSIALSSASSLQDTLRLLTL
ncbi:phosphatidylinositol kinase- protein kinase tor1, partial [Friedmanniomyces endolithicus]